MIDEKRVADGRAGMDVYASLVVNVLAHDARQQRDIALVQEMNNAVNRYGCQARIGYNDFSLTLGGRVSFKSSPYVLVKPCPDLGQSA